MPGEPERVRSGTGSRTRRALMVAAETPGPVASIRIATAEPAILAMWDAVYDLAQELPAEHWVLVGGLMVQLHAFRFGGGRLRATHDIDLLANSRVRPSATEKTADVLLAAGFIPEEPQGAFEPLLVHRFTRGGVVVDVLRRRSVRAPGGAHREGTAATACRSYGLAPGPRRLHETDRGRPGGARSAGVGADLRWRMTGPLPLTATAVGGVQGRESGLRLLQPLRHDGLRQTTRLSQRRYPAGGAESWWRGAERRSERRSVTL